MQNNSYNSVKKYFSQLVENHNEIRSFVGFFNRELQHKEASRYGLPSPYLALFGYEIGLDGGKPNTVAVRKIQFAVMASGVPADDFEAQYAAIDRAEQLALSVLSRIQFDNNDKEHLLYNTFVKDSVRILPVELSNTAYGVEVYFHLKNPQNLTLNPDLWADVEKRC